jgi:branched-chain amino acid transport system ATP-binding protein
MLTLTDLEVSYGAVRSVNGISLEVAAGEAVGLLGPNGAGKTSTLNAIAGLVRAKVGRLELFGEDISGLSTEQRLRRGLALVPQGRELFPNLTVAENIRTGQWSSRRWRRGGLDPAIFEVFPHLAERLNQRAGTLSGGEQQMCAIARAMASRPKLLLLDEPSMGLSPKLVSSVVAMLHKLARDQGISMVIVEQGVGILTRLTSRILLISSGRIVSEVDTAAEDASERLAASYFG